MKLIKPKKLENGDVIGIIAPSSPVQDTSRIENGVKYLESLGYRVELGKSVYASHGYLAGTDSERLDDLHSMFKNKHVKAILALRGGFGATRLLDQINYKYIKDNPKIFIGYSDISALQMAFYSQCKLITFAGPMLATDFGGEIDPFTEDNFWKTLTSNKKIGKLHNPEEEKFFILNKGRGEGKLVGGNLSVLCSIAGSKYLPSLKKSILFLEEINEPPYRIDRMLTHLRLNGVFKDIEGIILGRFVDCYESDSSKQTLTLNEVIAEHFSSLKIPVLYNFKHGHIPDTLTVPIGVNCKLNSSRGFIEITENAVS